MDLLIYTSYVSPANMKMFEKNELLPIFILRNIRNSKLIGKYSDSAVHFKDLSPSNALYQAKRDKKISIEEFKEDYKREISNIPLENIIKRLKSLAEISNAKAIVLLGYGSDSSVCHRTVLSELLNQSGLLSTPIKEIACQ